MTNRNSSNINIPEAREAMDKFKMEAASDVGVPKPETKITSFLHKRGCLSMMLQNHLRQLYIQKGIAACRNCSDRRRFISSGAFPDGVAVCPVPGNRNVYSTLPQPPGVEFRKDLLSLLLTDPQLLSGQ